MSDKQKTQFSITRQQAASRGLRRFWTGRKCKHAHLTERFVSNGQCVTCNALKAREKERQRSLEDAAYRMYRNVQRRSGQALGGAYSPALAIGCTKENLQLHIERKFTEGMIWSKYGQWEVDHIIPLSAADGEEDIIQLCNYTNLQPLWKRENRMKGGA